MTNKKLTSLDCKNAILKWLEERPLHVFRQFSDREPDEMCVERNCYCKGKKTIIEHMEVWNPREERHVIIHTLEELNEIALKRTNWRRFEKRYNKEDGSVERGFNCSPFEDQIRGYVVEKNNKIVNVYVVGE